MPIYLCKVKGVWNLPKSRALYADENTVCKVYRHIHTQYTHTHRARNGQMAGAITCPILREVFNWSQCFTIWGWSNGW